MLYGSGRSRRNRETIRGESPAQARWRSTRATTTRPRTTLSSLPCSPALDLRSKPELDPALPEIEYGVGHIVIALLVLKDGVAVREAEDFGDAFGVD